MPRSAMRQVAIFIETWSAHGRGVLRGIHRYQQDHGPWAVVFRPHTPGDAPAWLRHWKGDGVLASVSHPRFAAALRRIRLPVVNVYWRPDPTFPQLLTDNDAIGRLAADHLSERGLRHFGVVGWPRGINPRMDERCDCFVRHLKRAGFRCSVFEGWRTDRTGKALGWDHERICAWMRSLPKPVGVMACC